MAGIAWLLATVTAVSARWSYEDAYDNVAGGDWYSHAKALEAAGLREQRLQPPPGARHRIAWEPRPNRRTCR